MDARRSTWLPVLSYPLLLCDLRTRAFVSVPAKAQAQAQDLPGYSCKITAQYSTAPHHTVVWHAQSIVMTRR